MKRLILVPLFILAFAITSYSQTLGGFGFTGGLNYNGNGNYFQSIDSNAQHPDKNVGYHLGVFYKIGNRIYVKPVLLFTSTKSGYDDGDFKMQKIDVPVLVGIKVIGPLSVFAGPSFQYILDSDYDGDGVLTIFEDIDGDGDPTNDIGMNGIPKYLDEEETESNQD